MRQSHSSWPLLIALAFLTGAAVFPMPAAASQAGPAAGRPSRSALQDRIVRVRPTVLAGGGDMQAAIRELHAILAIDPKAAEAHLLLGLAYGQLTTPGMAGEAVAELRQALAIQPGLTPARTALAYLYLDLGQPDRAREEAEAALKTAPREPQFLVLQGEAERRLGRAERAIEIHRRALAIESSFVPARYYLALALLDLDRRDEAVAELERLVQSGANLAGIYFTLGSTYLEGGQVDAALRTFEQGLQFGQPRPDVQVQLARAYRLKGRLPQAEALLDAALPPGAAMQASGFYQDLQADVDTERGMIKLQQGQLDAAAELFQRALTVKPDQASAHHSLAEVLLRLGRHKEASAHANRARELGSPLPADRIEAIEKALGR